MRWLLTALFCLLVIPEAVAHEFEAQRSAVLQLHTSHAELLLVYVEPAGPRAERLLALYDQNRDGKFDAVEERLARRALLERAFYGLELGFDVQRADKTAELRTRREPDGGISVAVLQRIDLIVPSNRLTVTVAVRAGETIPALELIIEPAGAWQFEGRSAELKTTIAPGQSYRATAVRTATPADGEPTDWTPPVPRDGLDGP